MRRYPWTNRQAMVGANSILRCPVHLVRVLRQCVGILGTSQGSGVQEHVQTCCQDLREDTLVIFAILAWVRRLLYGHEQQP